LKKMETTLLLIRNIAAQSETPEEVLDLIDDVRGSLEETFETIAEGSAE